MVIRNFPVVVMWDACGIRAWCSVIFVGCQDAGGGWCSVVIVGCQGPVVGRVVL